MTVESNYVIAIATLSDWLKRAAPVFQPMRSKAKTNRTMYEWFFPRRLFLLWLVGVIALVLFFRQSFENRYNNNEINRQYDLNRFMPITIIMMVLGHGKEKFKCLQSSDLWRKMKWSLDIVVRKKAAKKNLVYTRRLTLVMPKEKQQAHKNISLRYSN